MKRWWLGALLALYCVTAQAADPCVDKVAAGILAHDRDTRQGVGLLFNYCGRPVKTELLVSATNLSGFVIARIRTVVQAGADTLSVITVDLPFVQSAMQLSGYEAEVATVETLDAADDRTALLQLLPAPIPKL